MMELSEIERYLNGLYETYEALHTEYKNLHKRSRMHDMETAENYYHRWRSKLLAEIGRMERELVGYAQLDPSFHSSPSGEATNSVKSIVILNEAKNLEMFRPAKAAST